MVRINREVCVACGRCRAECEVDAIVVVEGKFQIVEQECVECGACMDRCPVGAISEVWVA